MSITKFNRNNSIDWNYETKDFEFKKASEMKLDTVYPIHGVFTTPDNGYGVGAVIILDDCLLNAPQHEVDTTKAVMADPETVEEIKAGKCGIKISTYTSKKFKRTGYSIEFVEI